MWYVVDRDHDIVIAALRSRRAAYEVRKNHKSLYPTARVRVEDWR